MSKKLTSVHIASLMVGGSVDAHRYFIGAFTTPLRAAISLTQNKQIHFARVLPKFDITLTTIWTNDKPVVSPGVPQVTWSQLSTSDDDIEDVPGSSRYVYLLAERKSEPPYVFPLGVYDTKELAYRNGTHFADQHYTTVCTYTIVIDPYYPMIADAADVQTRDYYAAERARRLRKPEECQDSRMPKRRKIDRAIFMNPAPRMLHDVAILPTPTPMHKDKIQKQLDDFFETDASIDGEHLDSKGAESEDSYDDEESEFILPSFGFTTVGSDGGIEDEHRPVEIAPSQQKVDDTQGDISVLSLSAEVVNLKGLCTDLSSQLAELRAIVLKSSESQLHNKETT